MRTLWHQRERERERERERDVLFNDALNTFYLRLYGVSHMVKDHSDSEKGNPLPPHRLLISINRQDNTYHGLCYTSRGALAGTRNSSIDPTTHRTMSERSIKRKYLVKVLTKESSTTIYLLQLWKIVPFCTALNANNSNIFFTHTLQSYFKRWQ